MSSSILNRLFEEERQRIFTPSPHFCERVMSRLEVLPAAQQSIWEGAFNLTLSVAVCALIIIVALVGLTLVRSPEPNQDLTQMYLDSEIQVVERLLYIEPTLAPSVVIEEVILQGIE